MLRGLLRLLLVVIIIVAAGAFFLGYRWGGDRITAPTIADRPIGTTGTVNTARAREAGAEVGEKVAVGAAKAEKAVEDASLTTKIKAKMALDDTVRASAIDVDTNGSIVTLTGTLSNPAEKAKALELARDTEGVTAVVDHLTLRQ